MPPSIANRPASMPGGCPEPPSRVAACGRLHEVVAVRTPFEAVVSEHGATVLGVCRAVLGTRPEADDAWSETFLAALKAWPSLPQEANVEAWLVTIAHRKAIDVVRARQRHAIPVGAVPDDVAAVTEPETCDGELWDAVKALPDKQRQALAYHYVAGLPYAQIADILGGSTAAARRAAADGMKSLRTRMGASAPQKGSSR